MADFDGFQPGDLEDYYSRMEEVMFSGDNSDLDISNVNQSLLVQQKKEVLSNAIKESEDNYETRSTITDDCSTTYNTMTDEESNNEAGAPNNDAMVEDDDDDASFSEPMSACNNANVEGSKISIDDNNDDCRIRVKDATASGNESIDSSSASDYEDPCLSLQSVSATSMLMESEIPTVLEDSLHNNSAIASSDDAEDEEVCALSESMEGVYDSSSEAAVSDIGTASDYDQTCSSKVPPPTKGVTDIKSLGLDTDKTFVPIKNGIGCEISHITSLTEVALQRQPSPLVPQVDHIHVVNRSSNVTILTPSGEISSVVQALHPPNASSPVLSLSCPAIQGTSLVNVTYRDVHARKSASPVLSGQSLNRDNVSSPPAASSGGVKRLVVPTLTPTVLSSSPRPYNQSYPFSSSSSTRKVICSNGIDGGSSRSISNGASLSSTARYSYSSPVYCGIVKTSKH